MMTSLLLLWNIYFVLTLYRSCTLKRLGQITLKIPCVQQASEQTKEKWDETDISTFTDLLNSATNSNLLNQQKTSSVGVHVTMKSPLTLINQSAIGGIFHSDKQWACDECNKIRIEILVCLYILTIFELMWESFDFFLSHSNPPHPTPIAKL